MLRKTLISMFMDLGKLSFGSLILGSFLRGGLDTSRILMIGYIFAIISFVIGIFIAIKTKE